MKKLIEQIVKFGVVGVIATLIDMGIYAIFCEIYKANGGLQSICIEKDWCTLATIISFSVSVTFNYIASMKYVFERREDMSRIKEFAIFMILSIIGLGINVAIIRGLNGWGLWVEKNAPGLIARFAYMYPKVIATLVVLVWNFVSRKITLEKKEA